MVTSSSRFTIIPPKRGMPRNAGLWDFNRSVDNGGQNFWTYHASRLADVHDAKTGETFTVFFLALNLGNSGACAYFSPIDPHPFPGWYCTCGERLCRHRSMMEAWRGSASPAA